MQLLPQAHSRKPPEFPDPSAFPGGMMSTVIISVRVCGRSVAFTRCGVDGDGERRAKAPPHVRMRAKLVNGMVAPSKEIRVRHGEPAHSPPLVLAP
jgi:hypothetical protein